MAGQKMSPEQLKGLVAKAKANPAFRDKLLSSPADTLTSEGLDLTDRNLWVDFFKSLNASNFEREMDEAIRGLEGEATGRG
jgi:hypothetical protein